MDGPLGAGAGAGAGAAAAAAADAPLLDAVDLGGHGEAMRTQFAIKQADVLVVGVYGLRRIVASAQRLKAVSEVRLEPLRVRLTPFLLAPPRRVPHA